MRGSRGAIAGAGLMAAALFSSVLAFAVAQPSLNVYFQSTLTDTAYQKATFDRVARSWIASDTMPVAIDMLPK